MQKLNAPAYISRKNICHSEPMSKDWRAFLRVNLRRIGVGIFKPGNRLSKNAVFLPFWSVKGCLRYHICNPLAPNIRVARFASVMTEAQVYDRLDQILRKGGWMEITLIASSQQATS
ncbi:hypothetical protein RF11_01337 [Thelohanellus kitauei]|uniref:Uncharacterized protein n=1 Tax=Thelohanellus kitauei TaxID=669202 RepID=A0A0C2J1Q2_THEKT|nr:hypothetical protein RF11_01337 [Thelohanellus kitauei]